MTDTVIIGLMGIIALLILIIMVLVWIIVKRPKQIVYVEKPRNTTVHDKPVDVDVEFQKLFRKIIQRNGTVSSYQLMYVVGIAASDTEEPAPMTHWIENGVIYFNFTSEIARQQAMNWVNNAIIRDHRALAGGDNH